MANTNKISQELKQISPLVAGLDASHPYQTPPGYFEGLAEQILSRVKTPENASSSLEQAALTTPYAAPPAYFENLAETVMSRIRAMEAASPREEIEALSPVLGQLDKKLPFSVPPGYFDDLSRDILSGANAIDLVYQQFDPVSPVLEGIRNINVYRVAPGYFDKLPEQVIKKARRGQQAALIPMNFSKRLVRYAAAAVITGIIAIGAWLFLQPEPSPASGNELAAIEKLSDDEIVNYLDNNQLPGAENNIASFDLKEEDLKELLTDVSDQELQQYLDQHGVAKEATIN